MGSWKIMEISFPLIRLSSSGVDLSKFLPSKFISPEIFSIDDLSRRPMMARDVTDLPEPLSPTMAVVLPSRVFMFALFTALTIPWELLKKTSRSFISNNILPPELWIKGIS